MEVWGTWEYEGKIEPNEQGGGVVSIREGLSEKGILKLGAEKYVGVHKEDRRSSIRITSSLTPSPAAPEKINPVLTCFCCAGF